MLALLAALASALSAGDAVGAMAVFDRGNNFNKIQQHQIWNRTIAFGYPALASNACTGEIGLSLEFGGGGNFENHAVA